MGRTLMRSGALILLLAGLARADDAVSCKGNITSKQGEGLLVKTFRFEVAVAGSDLADLLDRCKKIALQRQNRAGHANPGVGFRKSSDLDLACTRGSETFPLRRTLQTAP